MTFNLSERIEQLKNELNDNAKLTYAQVDGIIRMVAFMDREFIKKLKDAFQNVDEFSDFSYIINELAGEKLIVPQAAQHKVCLNTPEGVDVCDNPTCGHEKGEHGEGCYECFCIKFKPKEVDDE